jgi:tetrahydromethanopterin S-methyltransferase subunit E
MVETDTYQKSLEKREFRSTVCALCVWLIVFVFSWVTLTMEYPLETMSLGELVTLLLIQLISLFAFLLAIYKIGKAILNLYKHR